MAVTDTKYNIRSNPIRAAAAESEILIQNKRQIMMKAYEEVKSSHCDDRGHNF